VENTPDLNVAVTGMVEATITRFLGGDVMQEFHTEVHGGPSAGDRPAPLEIVLAYGQQRARRTIVLDDVANRTELETGVSAAVLPMLQEMGLVPTGATQAT
jgi:hypothetical protein